MSTRVPSWVRASLLLLCVAVVGTLIGVGWESFSAEEPGPVVALPGAWQDVGLPTSPVGETGLSEAERQVVRRATAQLPAYRDAVPLPLAADFLGSNSPIAVAWFATRDTPEQVLGFYRKAILEAGLPVMQQAYSARAGYVGHVEPGSHETHLISVMAEGDETLVFVSSGTVEAFLEGPAALPQGVPLPEGASQPVVLAFREEGRVRYSVQAEVPHTRAGKVAGAYREALTAQGWKLEQAVPGDEGTHLLASRGDSRVSALVQPARGGAQLLLTMDTREQME